MGEVLYRYYSEKDLDIYSHIKIPKILFKDPEFTDLSIQAKVLYGFMLDRMALAGINDWYDKNGNVYITYTTEEIRNDLNCSIQSAVNYMKELTAIGLIEKKKVKSGKPTLIYVKRIKEDKSEQKKKSEVPKCGIFYK